VQIGIKRTQGRGATPAQAKMDAALHGTRQQHLLFEGNTPFCSLQCQNHLLLSGVVVSIMGENIQDSANIGPNITLKFNNLQWVNISTIFV
jgi:hypothetical protein